MIYLFFLFSVIAEDDLIKYENLLTENSHLTMAGTFFWFLCYYGVEKMVKGGKYPVRTFIKVHWNEMLTAFFIGVYWVTVDDKWLPILFDDNYEELERWKYFLCGPAVQLVYRIVYIAVKKFQFKPQQENG